MAAERQRGRSLTTMETRTVGQVDPALNATKVAAAVVKGAKTYRGAVICEAAASSAATTAAGTPRKHKQRP